MKYDIHQTANSLVFTVFSSIFTSKKDLEVDHGGGGVTTYLYFIFVCMTLVFFLDAFPVLKSAKVHSLRPGPRGGWVSFETKGP